MRFKLFFLKEDLSSRQIEQPRIIVNKTGKKRKKKKANENIKTSFNFYGIMIETRTNRVGKYMWFIKI